MHIFNLPIIFLLQVFLYLDEESQKKFSKVCKRFAKCWKMIVGRFLDFSSEWRTLEKFPLTCTEFACHVSTKLSFRYCTKVKSFDFLPRLHLLKVIDLYGTNVRDLELNCISKKIQLTAINLGYCRKLTPDGIRDFLRTQVSLRGIGLASCGFEGSAVTNEVSRYIQKFKIEEKKL